MRRVRIAERQRTAKVIELCRKGYQCALIDVDVALHKSISPLFDIPQDLVFSRAFGVPRVCVQKIGFVACTGFWIASSVSVPFLSRWLAEMEMGSEVDQNLLNLPFMHLQWNSAPFIVDGAAYENSVASLDGCSIAVLDRRIIERGLDRTDVTFGNHDRTVPRSYWRPMQTPTRISPLKAALRSFVRRMKSIFKKT